MLDSTQPGWAQCLQRAAAPPSHAHPLAQYLAHALQQGRPLAQAHGPALLLEAWLAGTEHTTFARAQPAHRALPFCQLPPRAIDWQRLQNGQRANGTRNSPWPTWPGVHLSPSQFTARCRDELGLGAIEWLRQQRLAHARLLRASGMPVAAVAASATGYRSPSALTAALRRDALAEQAAKPSDSKRRLNVPATAATTIAARRYSGAARRWSALQNAYSRRMSSSPLQANLYALGAIALWASLASLGVSLTHIPPFLLTGITLIIGSVPAWPLCCAIHRSGAFHAHAGAGRLWPVCVPLSAVHRAAACAAGGGQPRQLPVAPVHRGAGPGGVPGVALRVPHVVAALLGLAGGDCHRGRPGTGGTWPGATFPQRRRRSSGPPIRR